MTFILWTTAAAVLLLQCSADPGSTMSTSFETLVLPKQASLENLSSFLQPYSNNEDLEEEQVYMVAAAMAKFLEQLRVPAGFKLRGDLDFQNGVLLPLVEEVRQQIVPQLETFLNKRFDSFVLKNECFEPFDFYSTVAPLNIQFRKNARNLLCENAKEDILRLWGSFIFLKNEPFTPGMIVRDREVKRPPICGVELSKFVDEAVNLFHYIKSLEYFKSILSRINGPPRGIVGLTSEQIIRSSLRNVVNKMRKSRVKSYELVLTEGICSPDNFVQTCYLINGQYPGPPIVVDQHDSLVVKVVNRLSTRTTMHFHGILQTHSVASDGVEHVTQAGIEPNASYTYEMMIGEQTGTFMYHGHVGLDLVWLHGALIVRENQEVWKHLGAAFQYDHEHTYLLEEIFHESFEKLINDMVVDGVDDPEVASFAINGKSFGTLESTSQAHSNGYEVLSVVPGHKYRLRVINVAAGSMLRFSIESHNLTIIEMDGIITEPVVTPWLEVHTGQRYSVLVEMNQPVGNYWVQSRLISDDGEPGPDNGRAIIHYDCAEDPEQLRFQVFTEKSEGFEINAEAWVLDQLRPNLVYKQSGVYDFPSKADRTILIDMQMRTEDGPPRYLVNGKRFEQPEMPFVDLVRGGQSLNHSHVFGIKKGEVIDLVLQNRVDDTGGCDSHPVHLHGHSFWVADMAADEANLEHLQISEGNNRQFRDTFLMYPNATTESNRTGAPCGYAVVRFVADNPGLWLVHCHVTSHMILGKMFVLHEYDDRNYSLVNE